MPRSASSPPAEARGRCSIVEAFDAVATRRAGAVAAECGERRLTYAELREASHRLAQRLVAHGTSPGDMVPVAAERSIDAVVAFLGILRAGAAYVPLAPDTPRPRAAFMVTDTGARLAVAEPRFAGRMHGLGCRVLQLDDSSDVAAERALPKVAAGALAYVMYTSGSTGRPKGVLVEHGSVTSFALTRPEVMPRPEDGVLGVARLDFDSSTYDIWGTLLNGARLVLHPAGRVDPAAVARTIADGRVTVAGLPTGLFHAMVDAALPRMAGLRLISTGGDVLSPSHARRFRVAHPDCRLINEYGPTETTVTVTWHVVEDVVAEEPVPIGVAHRNTHLYVLDDAGRPVAQGHTGELYIGGDGVARGYLNLPEETAAAFLDDPFEPANGVRMYRSGDLVRRRPDGALDFVGRADQQVKIRGFRVEPGEVEAHVAADPDVEHGVVLAREDVPGHMRLIACVVLSDGADPVAVRRRLADRLPAHMVPAVTAVERLPVTGTGKVDRRALDAEVPAAPRRTPAGSLEDRIAALFEQVLRTGPVEAGDDLFALGGDSLLALQVLARMRSDLGVELDLGALFDAPTPAGLAAVAGARESGAPLPALSARPAGERTGPISSSQAQVCFLTALDPESVAYQFQAMLRLEGRLDEAALEHALSGVIARHEILRTSFPRRGATWERRVEQPFPAPLGFHDVSSEVDPAASLERLAYNEFRQPLATDRLPLVRWTLVRLGPESHVLLHVEHHLIHDGWSFMLILRDLAELYRARVERRDPDLTEPAFQFGDFAHWQGELAGSDAGLAQLAYWEERLARLPDPLALPCDRARPPRQTFAGDQITWRVPPGLAHRLGALSRDAGTTLFMTMLAAYVALLRLLSGEEDVVVGSGLANRRLRELEEIAGMLVNTVALRVDASGDPTVRELIACVRAVVLGAQANQEIPFERVVRAIQPRREAGRAPVYGTLFSFHDSAVPDLRLPGLTMTIDDTPPNGSAKADVNVVVINRPDGPTVLWEYNSDLFTRATAEAMLGNFTRMLDVFAAAPDSRIGDLDLLDASSEGAVAARAAGPATPYERDSTIAAVFEDRVREAPGAIALVCGADAITYAELDSAANRLAHRLIGNGVERGTPVGVCMDRSPPAVVAILAALKAGAAYVPLDPALPPARLRALTEDVAMPVIVSERRFAGRLPAGATILDGASALRGGPCDPPAIAGAATDLAYVMHTSGSTGRPKGVEVAQRGVLRLVRGADFVELGPDETLLALAPMSFDASTLEIWGALLNGGRLALAPAGALSPFEIAEAIRRHGVTTLWLTAGLFHRMVEQEPEALAEVRQVLAGGDVLSPSHVVRALEGRPAGGVVVNGYGPHENTTFTCCHVMRTGDVSGDRVPIGRPIANTRAYVLDERMRPVPDGVVGELWAGGDGVAIGYRGRPDLTAERFRPDPFGSPGDRIYRTGDLVRRRTDGVLDFLGRADRQVKVRGFRVEPAEVEAELLRHPAVHAAAVVPRGVRADQRRLVAYLVAKGGRADVRDLRTFLSERLPAPLVPSAWVQLDELPLTANGKVDRAALPEPEVAGGGRAARAVTAQERELTRLFEEVLGVAPVGPGDDFFDLGGHSLLAVELFAAIERTVGARLPLATIFEAPTVERLAELVACETRVSDHSSVVPLTATGSRPPLFCVTAGDGNAVGFGALARRLGREQPFYALQPRGLDGRAPLQARVERMARYFVRRIASVPRTGPYLLAGRCLGGLVAFEMARLLEQRGEEVALVAILDSLGPRWATRPLAGEIAFDEVMNNARLRALAAAAADPPSPENPDRFVSWLREPAPTPAAGLNRYVYEAYLARPDVQAAYPNVSNGDGERVVDWAWVSGRDEMGLQPELLPPASAHARDLHPPRAPRGARVAAAVRARAADWADVAGRGRLRTLAHRRERRLDELGRAAADRYRARPYGGRITLMRTMEFMGNGEIARWHGVESAGVDEHVVRGSHRSMMREPDVASLAECLEQCIAEATADRASARHG